MTLLADGDVVALTANCKERCVVLIGLRRCDGFVPVALSCLGGSVFVAIAV